MRDASELCKWHKEGNQVKNERKKGRKAERERVCVCVCVGVGA